MNLTPDEVTNLYLILGNGDREKGRAVAGGLTYGVRKEELENILKRGAVLPEARDHAKLMLAQLERKKTMEKYPPDAPELPNSPGLLVRVTVTHEGNVIRSALVDFTRHEGRRHIADLAQWAMPCGYVLSTVKTERQTL